MLEEAPRELQSKLPRVVELLQANKSVSEASLF